MNETDVEYSNGLSISKEYYIKCADLNMYTTLFSHIFDKFLKLKLI